MQTLFSCFSAYFVPWSGISNVTYFDLPGIKHMPGKAKVYSEPAIRLQGVKVWFQAPKWLQQDFMHYGEFIILLHMLRLLSIA